MLAGLEEGLATEAQPEEMWECCGVLELTGRMADGAVVRAVLERSHSCRSLEAMPDPARGLLREGAI